MSVLLLAWISLASSNGFASNTCAQVFAPNSPVRDILSLAEVQLKAMHWKIGFEHAVDSARYGDAARIKDEASTYAGQLIRLHRNREFFEFYQLFPISLNRELHETYKNGYDDEYFQYGRYLLEDAILSGNVDVYVRLQRLDSHQVPYIGVWNRALTRAVLDVPRFTEDALNIRSRAGRFDARLLNVGLMTPQRLEAFREIAGTRNIQTLFEHLSDLFPAGMLAGEGIDNRQQRSPAGLNFEMPCHCAVGGMEDHSLRAGDQINERWLHMEIFDSRFYKQGWINGRYTETTKFNLQPTRHLKTDEPYRVGARVPVGTREKNWIEDIEIANGQVRILVERDKDGVFYDRGTRYQELTLFFDKTKRVTGVEIANGNSRLFKKTLGWKRQRFLVPENTRSRGRVSFEGYEDLATQEITK